MQRGLSPKTVGHKIAVQGNFRTAPTECLTAPTECLSVVQRVDLRRSNFVSVRGSRELVGILRNSGPLSLRACP